MLYICSTPIGNLGDVSLRLLDTLRAVQVIACEDTRRTLKLLTHFGISGPRLVSLHEHNEQARLEEILGLLRSGVDVALVSDAGTPTFSDPGFTLVRACRLEGLAVTAVPGPSAGLTALVLSGLPTDRFLFVGFLPRDKKKLAQVVADAAAVKATLVGFESPRRIRSTLGELAALAPGCRIALCRELTKVHEEVLCGTPSEVRERLPESVRGEIVLVMHCDAGVTDEKGARGADGWSGAEPDLAEKVRVVQEMLHEGAKTRFIARKLAETGEMSRGAAYEFVLAVKRGLVGAGPRASVC